MVERSDILALVKKTEDALIDQFMAKLIERFRYIEQLDFKKAKESTADLMYMVRSLSDQDDHFEREF